MFGAIPIRGSTSGTVLISSELLLNAVESVVCVRVELCKDGVRIAGLIFGAALHIGDFVCVIPGEVTPTVDGSIAASGGLGPESCAEGEEESEGEEKRAECSHID